MSSSFSRPFRLSGALSIKFLPVLLTAPVEDMLERVLGLRQLDRLYRQLPVSSNIDEFLHNSLDLLGIRHELIRGSLDTVPQKGGTIVVCNHPFGGVEGMLLAALLRRHRTDVRIMANHYLCHVPELCNLFIPVDPFGGSTATRRNLGPLRDAVRWVRQGGLLVVFPAGEVSHLSLGAGFITDPPWSGTIGRLIRMTRAAVTPFCIDGSNSRLFQLAGLIHPRLRTLMLPRELINKRNSVVGIRIGSTIAAGKLPEEGRDSELIEYLRFRAYLLRDNSGEDGQASERTSSRRRTASARPLACARTPAELARDIAALPDEQLLLEQGSTRVYFGYARQLGCVMPEIGRLRELTFRAVGEGTGKALDTDAYDEHYVQLFAWDTACQQIIGAYRLGMVDDIIARFGRKGLYTWSLFDYQTDFLHQIAPAIELGRSFIRPEWQRNYASLLLLWKGIGQYIVRHPHYRVLFGPVSISDKYSYLSLQAMIGYLEEHNFPRNLAQQIRPRRKLRHSHGGRMGDIVLPRPASFDGLCDMVALIEEEKRGVPVLLKQYLKLGGQVLGFNVDRDFGYCVDALLLVDLPATPGKVLNRYMGNVAAKEYLMRHSYRTERKTA